MWEAVLVEANPRFNAPLQQLTARFPQQVRAAMSTAAYMCEGRTSFFLDTVNTATNYWGSSLSSTHKDVQNSGSKSVEVNLMNINRVLYEAAIPGDWVVVKMDIEGAEFDILPCMAQAPAASLIDTLLMEVHEGNLALTNTTQHFFLGAQEVLRQRGVLIPKYNS